MIPASRNAIPDVSTAPQPIRSAASLAELELKALLDTAVDGVIIIDCYGRIEQFNRSAERLFGFGAAEVVGHNVSMLMPAPHRARHDAYIQRYLRTGEAHILGVGREIGAQRKDGSVFPARLSIGELRTADVPRFVGFVHDLSDSKQAQLDLIEAHRRAQSYLDLADVILLALDRQGRVTMINRKGCEILGYSEQELHGRDWIATCVQATEQESVQGVFTSLARARNLEQHGYHENTVITRDGRARRVAWHNSLLLDDEGEVAGTLSSGEDVTERQHAEEEAQRTRERLTHVSRLSTMGEMAGGLAHEINQPLTAITVYAQACARLLEHGAEHVDEMREALAQISAQAIRAGEVIRRLRAMVKQHATRRATIDCNQIVRELITLAGPDARANDIALRLELAPDPLPVCADVVQIQQVLLNLIRNAIDATLAVAQSARRIDIRTALLDDEVEVNVVDYGCGLTQEARERLFEPFFTTKSSGTGLGLSISRGIVRDHGGRLQCAPNPQGGSAFSFTLPLAKEDA
jgi:two-component system sensor kinase FixL